MEARGCIFVDGENLRHSLLALFPSEFRPDDYLPRNADWAGLFDHLTKEARATTRLRTYWYVVEYIDFWPWGLNRAQRDLPKSLKLLAMDKKARAYMTTLPDQAQREAFARQKIADLLRYENAMRRRFEGWKAFQDGITHRFDSIEFRRAGSINCNLFTKLLGREKAVDVKLATDLLELREIYDVGIILSGDQDYTPAVQAAKDSGKQLVNVSFLKRDGEVLPGGARRLNQATDRTIEMPYADVIRFMNFASRAQAAQAQTITP